MQQHQHTDLKATDVQLFTGYFHTLTIQVSYILNKSLLTRTIRGLDVEVWIETSCNIKANCNKHLHISSVLRDDYYRASAH